VYLLFGFSVVEVWKYFFLIQNFATPIAGFFPESWSLPVKEMGYILVVIFLLLSATLLPKFSKKYAFLTIMIGLLLAAFLGKLYYDLHSNNLELTQWSFQIRSVVIYRIDSVLIGVLFGCFYLNYKEFMMSNRMLFLFSGILIFIFLAFCILVLKFNLTNASWFWNIICLPTVSLAICMFIPILMCWNMSSIIIQKSVTFVCNISYSVYLLHYSLVLFLMKYFVDTSQFNLLQLNIFTIVYVLITVGLSYLLYTYFEKPINEFRAKNLKLNDK
jgi:peptidoglycan/LPS O-acetylase OafA/YrhL